MQQVMADPPSRQDSAKSANSDKDLDSRQTAMDELKDCVRQLDEKTMPQFLDQVSEARDSEVSCNYAISLYSEVARVHKGGIIPFIPRIMASIVRSLPSSGNSQQLHLACTKVITSVARYTIDPTKPLASNQDLLRSLCIPLLSALSTKLEPLSVVLQYVCRLSWSLRSGNSSLWTSKISLWYVIEKYLSMCKYVFTRLISFVDRPARWFKLLKLVDSDKNT